MIFGNIGYIVVTQDGDENELQNLQNNLTTKFLTQISQKKILLM